MRECVACGMGLPIRRERGHREREYCSERCRQRACRERNAARRERDQLKRKADERAWNELQRELDCIGYPPRAWQVELWLKDVQLEQMKKRIQGQDELIEMLKESRSDAWLWNLLAEKEAEIVRLQTLLESTARKRR